MERELENVDPEYLAAIVKAADEEVLPQGAADVHQMEKLSSLGDEMYKLKMVIDDLEAAAKQHKVRYDELRKELIPDQMKRMRLVSSTGQGSFVMPNDARVTLVNKRRASYLVEDKPKLHAWLKDEGMGDIIKYEVNAQTFEAVMRERVADKKPIPPFVKVFTEVVATLYPGKKK